MRRTSPFEEGGTDEYLWSQTTSVKLRGGSLGMPGNTALQSYAKYLYTCVKNEKIKRYFDSFQSALNQSTHLPRVSEIVRSLYQHDGWPECFESYDQMSEMKFSFEIQSNRDVFHAVL